MIVHKLIIKLLLLTGLLAGFQDVLANQLVHQNYPTPLGLQYQQQLQLGKVLEMKHPALPASMAKACIDPNGKPGVLCNDGYCDSAKGGNPCQGHNGNIFSKSLLLLNNNKL